MEVTAERTDACTIVLDITVDEQQVSRAFENIYREFGRYARIPGFRPGKAPRAIIERYVDAERVRQQTLEKIIRDTYPKAIEEEGITPYRDPELEPTDLEDKKPYSYKATVPLPPEITLGAYTSLTVEKPIIPITDEMIEERLESLRNDRARLDRVTDRGVQEGDVLIVENTIQVEGEEEAPTPRRQLVYLGNNVPGYDEAVMGMMSGEERTFEITYPEDYDEEDKRGKKATYTVKLSSISAKRLPELDEEFAKQVAGVETVDDLRKALRERLEAEATRISNEVAEQRIIEQIVANSQIHFPAVLVREEVEEKLRRLAYDLRQNNLTYDQYLSQIGQTKEQHQGQLFAQSEAQIRSLLALRQVAAQEELQTDNDAIDAHFDRMLNEGSLSAEQYEEFKEDPNRRQQVASALIQQSLHDFLFANNTIVEVEQPAAAQETEEGSTETAE